jgi:hypothetical protein
LREKVGRGASTRGGPVPPDQMRGLEEGVPGARPGDAERGKEKEVKDIVSKEWDHSSGGGYWKVDMSFSC